MMIEKVHGLQATSLTLNDRFTLLATVVPSVRAAPKTRRWSSSVSVSNLSLYRNKQLIEQRARRLDQQAKRQHIHQRLGTGQGGLRRFGSESSLPGLRRSNSLGNLNTVKNRIGWRQSNGNLSRSASFSNLVRWSRAPRTPRGIRRRGGARPLRSRFRGMGGGGKVIAGRVLRQARRFSRPGRGRSLRGRGRSFRGLGRERGGMQRMRSQSVPSKEELDRELEQYMACTKAALDRELDVYMQDAENDENLLK